MPVALLFAMNCRLLIATAAYIQMHSRQLFTMEANTMNPDQTSPKRAVWSGSILFAI